ncbi:zinc finger protein 644a isoform X1 [Pangasianodon hypophthalmus]|uniref:zinc finger protein 644a isoform X1 n=1 Tax=Pangasianodon hypophthalmus TaxID=310915 RepID=UPI0023083161|nr:zinc finger protein 644a isoform X1 [Pangasianodon hypophthalmus]
MSALKENIKKEENDKPMSEISGPLTSKPAFSSEGSVLEASMQCPHENMTPNSDQADLLKHVSFIDSKCADGPAKAAYVNGSASPSISQEMLLDISKNVTGLLPKSMHTQNSTNKPIIQLEDCETLRKDGEMALRQMVTAEDVENRGIWGFDVDSPENSLDSYDDGDDLEWTPQKEFMKLLLEDQDCSETEAKIPAASSRRKCKLDKVMMVSPTENSKNYHLGEASQKEADPETKQSKMHSSRSNKSQYSNGTAVAFKHLLQKPAKIVKNSQKSGYVRENLSRDSGSEEEPALFPSNSSFKDKAHSQTHTKNCSNQKPFICKECGKDFYNHTSLLKHITVHQTKRRQTVEEITGTDEITNEGKDARLQCPQCTFGTNCPNTFVQHAKTHEKDKRYYPCQKCNFLAASKHELIAHMLSKHPVTDAQCTIIRRQDVLQGQKVGKSGRKPNLVRNHKSLDKDLLFLHDSENSNCSSSPESDTQQSMEPEDSNGLLQTDKPKSKDTADDKMDKSESKLDKSIHTLLSRKRNRDSESKSTPNFEEISVRAESPDLGKCCIDDPLNPEEGSPSPAKCKGKLFALKDDNSVCTLKSDGNGQGFSCNNDCSKGENSSTNHKRLPSEKLTLKKSPSKRKMSTPFHNLQGQDILIDFPKCRQIFQKNSNLYLIKKCDSKDGIHISNTTFRSPDASCELSKQESGLLQTVSIKEECMETEVCGDTNISDPVVKNGDVKVDLKSCPYCPAVFQSGIGLSNHIRGHLHRVGVSYKARHVVSVAQVASQDKVPPVRRRMAAIPQIKTEVDLPLIEQPSEPKSELTCPLCREWFDTKTGLSNHVRGHLKRLGKPCSTSTTKSPVIILKELMRDKKQFQIKLQALEKKCRSRNSIYPFKFSNGLIISTAKVQRFAQGGKRHGHVSSRSAEEKKRTESNKDAMKGSPSSDLIGILKKRRAHEEAKVKTLPQTARKALLVNAVKERDASAQLPNSVSEKSELNRKVCVHCNATFHSGVSLSNHLRAYARRKRNALLEGTTYDCKRKQRSRSGSKKKTHPLLHTPEEIYRLTCRFCDLVFQGPLSVQEDWVKHLQRHIMNTAVPHTGAAMVEVTCFPKDANTHTHPQTSS